MHFSEIGKVSFICPDNMWNKTHIGNMWNKTHTACSENTWLERKLTFRYKNHRMVWVERMSKSKKKNLSHNVLH